jgi:hypothetical protein
MTDPIRWTDDEAESTDFERDLLQAAQAEAMPSGDRDRIWTALECATVVATGTVVATAATRTSAASIVKSLVAVGAVGGLSMAGYFVTREVIQQNLAVSAAPALPAPRIAAPVASANTRPAPSPVTSAPAGAAPISSPPRAAPASLLEEESAAVVEIRRTLRAGDAGGALRLLEKARARFARGMLGQERESLTIEALARSGSREAAAGRADAFLRANPKSPYATDVRRFTDH